MPRAQLPSERAQMWDQARRTPLTVFGLGDGNRTNTRLICGACGDSHSALRDCAGRPIEASMPMEPACEACGYRHGAGRPCLVPVVLERGESRRPTVPRARGARARRVAPPDSECSDGSLRQARSGADEREARRVACEQGGGLTAHAASDEALS